MNKENETIVLNNELTLYISGNNLPPEIVRALKNYQPTEFHTKNKEDLLNMLAKE